MDFDFLLYFPLSPFQEGRYIVEKELEGVGLTPFDPYHNSSFVVAGK
jgi:hypothetical protein